MDDVFGEDPLNLTGDEKDELPDEFDPRLEEEFKKFFAEMSAGPGQEGPEDLKGLAEAMEGLMKEFGKDLPGDATSEPSLEGMANKLLEAFMSREIMEEPVIKALQIYEDILSKGQASKEDLARYKAQRDILADFLDMLLNKAEAKAELIAKFEEMQRHGPPPMGVVFEGFKDT